MITYLLFDSGCDDCVRVYNKISSMGLPCMCIPCRGMDDPEVISDSVRYTGMKEILVWLEKLDEEIRKDSITPRGRALS